MDFLVLTIAVVALATAAFLVSALAYGIYVAVQNLSPQTPKYKWHKVLERTDVSQTVFILKIEKPGRSVGWKAGQYVSLRIPLPDGRQISRAYSLAQWHPLAGCYELAIKKDGVGSGWLHANATKGMKIKVSRPMGHFTPDLSSEAPLVLIAGGIGITPMKAMAEQAIHQLPLKEPKRAVYLFYSSPNLGDMAYHTYFEQLASQTACFSYTPTLTRPCHGWNGRTGRLSARFIADTVDSYPTAHYYLCASNAMMDDLMEALHTLGVPQSHLHLERFGTSPLYGPAFTAKVVVNHKTHEYYDNCSLYDFMERTGTRLDGSCKAGHCGLCAVKMVSGRVRYFMSPEAYVCADHILPCCCMPLSDIQLEA